MRINSHHLALISAAACAIAPASAAAQSGTGRAPNNAKAAAPCTTDYSRNSVNGEYCASDAGAVAPVTTTSSPATVIKHDDGGFSWSDAGAGAGGAIAFRRRSPSVDPHRSAATH